MTLQTENWRSMLDLAEAAGALPNTLRRQAENILQALAEASGSDATLDVELGLRNGAIYLGFIPIAPAPRIILR